MRVSWDFRQVFHEGPTVFWLCFMCFMDVSELVTRKRSCLQKDRHFQDRFTKNWGKKDIHFQDMLIPNISNYLEICVSYFFSLIIFELNVDNVHMRAKVQSLWRMTLPSRQGWGLSYHSHQHASFIPDILDVPVSFPGIVFGHVWIFGWP